MTNPPRYHLASSSSHLSCSPFCSDEKGLEEDGEVRGEEQQLLQQQQEEEEDEKEEKEGEAESLVGVEEEKGAGPCLAASGEEESPQS